MEGKIDENGYLKITGRGKLYCPFCRNSGGQDNCGDWCPLFGEPTDHFISITDGHGIDKRKKDGIELQICHKPLYFDKFTDERK